MGWTYKALKDYEFPPDWLLEEREKQRDMMREHRQALGKRAALTFAEYVRRALGEAPGPWGWIRRQQSPELGCCEGHR